MNKKVLKTLEYHKIIEFLIDEADSTMGKKTASELLPMTDRDTIVACQSETSHGLMRILKQGILPLGGLKDVRPLLVPLEKGSILGAGELLDICSTLETTKRAKDYDDKFENLTDALSGRFHSLWALPDVTREINRCIISPEEISDEASPELKKIRRQMKGINGRVHEQLNKTLNSAASSGMLRDSIVTMRNGRYCLPVKAEYKSSFPGMILDQSSTGSTFFVEPMAVTQLNNELAELIMKENEEIQKILATLSEMVAPETNNIKRDVTLLAELDFIMAKARLSKKMQGSEPLFDEDYIEIHRGRHPLIPKEQVVPIDLTLGKDYELLIITGPNTGGKTVSLKTVGLFTLMGQAGLHIPAFDHSHLRVYHDVFADIGDEQSIEQSLSTFSSHMVNTISILEQADEGCLALFDELGAGTDPTEGAALAISILTDLKRRGVTAMATTHYPELKVFALSEEGVENASCEFDVNTLRPTYRLMIGVPGKSNAFAISGKLGLPHRIIDFAKEQIDADAKNFDDVIASLEEQRVALEKEKAELDEVLAQKKKQEQKLAEKNKRIDDAKEKIMRRANEEANDILQNAKDFADDSIKQFNKWMKGSGASKEMEQRRSALRDQLNKTGKNLQGTKKQSPNRSAPKEIKIGDTVMVHSLGVQGSVSSLPDRKGNLFVQTGVMKSTVNIKDLELIKEETFTINGQSRKESTKGKIKASKAMTISPEINLIGKTVDEAISQLDKYLDDAYISRLSMVTIIHGVGTGALRNAVQAHLKRTNYVKSYRIGEYGEGGYGVTIAEFK